MILSHCCICEPEFAGRSTIQLLSEERAARRGHPYSPAESAESARRVPVLVRGNVGDARFKVDAAIWWDGEPVPVSPPADSCQLVALLRNFAG